MTGKIVCFVPPPDCSGKVGYDCAGCVRLMYGATDVDCPLQPPPPPRPPAAA